jgi:hypothetical protein
LHQQHKDNIPQLSANEYVSPVKTKDNGIYPDGYPAEASLNSFFAFQHFTLRQTRIKEEFVIREIGPRD